MLPSRPMRCCFAAACPALTHHTLACSVHLPSRLEGASAGHGQQCTFPSPLLQVAQHIQEAAGLVEEARAARQAGLARERQLAAEVEALRERLSGRAPGADPLAALEQQARGGEGTEGGGVGSGRGWVWVWVWGWGWGLGVGGWGGARRRLGQQGVSLSS